MIKTGTYNLTEHQKKILVCSFEAPQPSSKTRSPDVTNLTWELPDSWIPSTGHSMRLASFDIPFSDGVGDLSIVSLGGASGGLLANVNRWRGQ